MNRREFIQASLGTGLSCFAGLSSFALAESSGPRQALLPPLIMVFLRGGADGLGILSPLDDPDFRAARPPQMRFDPTSNPITHQGLRFYWHPNAEPLAKLNLQGRLLPWHAVGITNETRSHFEAQEIMERGVNQLHGLPDDLGMMSRIAKTSGTAQDFLFSGSVTVPRAFQGDIPSLAIRDLQRGVSFPGGQEQLNLLYNLALADQRHPAATAMKNTLSYLSDIQKAMTGTDKKLKSYESFGKTPYPNSDPGVGLRSVARLLNSGIRLHYAWVDQGGWDMHENQPGRLNGTLNQLSQGLVAFDEDMQAQGRPYRMVVLTEFGRRFRSNSSNGLDHGHGGLAFVLGDGLPKGIMLGQWPGLDEKALDRGVDLAVTTPYQGVMQKALEWSFS